MVEEFGLCRAAAICRGASLGCFCVMASSAHPASPYCPAVRRASCRSRGGRTATRRATRNSIRACITARWRVDGSTTTSNAQQPGKRNNRNNIVPFRRSHGTISFPQRVIGTAGVSLCFQAGRREGKGAQARPVASRMALRMAGAMATIGVSPAPSEGRSLRSTSTISMGGTSRKRGTR